MRCRPRGYNTDLGTCVNQEFSLGISVGDAEKAAVGFWASYSRDCRLAH